jgi:predicted phosphodiesterase
LRRLAGVRLGVIADIHGNEVALRAVLKDAARCGVDRWWVLGDLVLFGPRPAEVLELLAGLPAVAMLRGNTDRYVLTGIRALNPGSTGQPRPAGHACWLLLADDGDGDSDGRSTLTAEHRAVPFDVAAVVRDLHGRRHPNAVFVESVLDGRA